MGDAELLVFAQRTGDICGGADQPSRARAAAAELAGRGVKIVVEHFTALMKVEQALLADGDGPLVVVPAGTAIFCHFGDLRLGIGPSFFCRVADQRRNPQPELKRRQVAVEVAAQPLQAIDPFPHAIKRLTPKELDVSFGGRDALGRFRCTTEIEFRMAALAASLDAWNDGGFC